MLFLITIASKKEKLLLLWDLSYDQLEWPQVRRYATPRKDLPLPTVRIILKQAGLYLVFAILLASTRI